MQVLQDAEHTFYWGKPPAPATPSTSAAATAPIAAVADAGSVTSTSSGGAEAGPPALQPLVFIQGGPSQAMATVVTVLPEQLHSIAAAGTVYELLFELREVLEAPPADGSSCPPWKAGAAALPPQVVEVALAKTAAWALDLEPFDGTDPDGVRQALDLLQCSLIHSRMIGYNVDDVGSVLWSLSSILGKYGWEPYDDTIGAVTSWLRRPENAAQIESYGKFSGLVSLLWGYAAMVQASAGDGAGGTTGGLLATGTAAEVPRSAVQRLDDPEHLEAVGATLDLLARRTAALMELSYGSGMPIDAVELTDVAWALPVIGRRSGAIAQLGEAVAHEVYRQVSNRYSLQAAFTPADLVKIVQSYAKMQLRDGSVFRMLDAVGGHVAKRIRSRHIHAFTRPCHCAELLQGFADTGHNSVVVPELFAACALQITREVATHNEDLLASTSAAAAASQTPQSNPGATVVPGGVAARLRHLKQPLWLRQARPSAEASYWHWSPFLPPDQILAVLRSYVRMGYHPGAALLDSLLLAVAPQLPHMPPRQVSELLQLLAAARHVPGEQTLGLLATAAHQRRGPIGAAANGTSSLERSAPGRPASDTAGAGPQRAVAAMEVPTGPDHAGGGGGGAEGSGSGGIPAVVARLQSLWALVMMGWGPTPEQVEEVLTPVLLDEDLVLSPEDAGRLLSLLCVLAPARPPATPSHPSSPFPATRRSPELTIQRFGLACVKLRDALMRSVMTDGGSGRRAGQQWAPQRQESQESLDEVLMAAGTAMVLLGYEGWEMAEQVLPPAVFRQVEGTVRRALERPYDHVDESLVAEAARALGEACGCEATVRRLAVPIIDDTDPGSSSAPDTDRGTDEGARPDSRDPDPEDGDVAFEALLFCPVVARLCNSVEATPPGPSRDNEASGLQTHEDPYSKDGFTTPPTAETAAAITTPAPAAAPLVILDICTPRDYGSNAAGQVLWGWARLRHALYGACTTGRLVVIDARKLASLQGCRDGARGYLVEALAARGLGRAGAVERNGDISRA